MTSDEQWDDSDDVEYAHMNEVVPGLWIGDIQSASDAEALRSKNIHSILSAMRGRVSIHPTFIHQQIAVDDEEEADILPHLVPAISFIQAELEKGRGVLVHCQAGMSRSATIVAAYLMYSQNIDATTALAQLKQARPIVQPNDGFLYQLEVFYAASFKITRKDKTMRMYYLERAVGEMLNGEGHASTDMFAKFPRTPGDSGPPTPIPHKRRIRCKMCRQELATREHMLDHGQLGPPTPASAYALSPAASRRQSATSDRRPSFGLAQQPRPRLGSSSYADTRPRRPSQLGREGGGGLTGLSMSALEAEEDAVVDDEDDEPGSSTASPASPSQPQPSPQPHPSSPGFRSRLDSRGSLSSSTRPIRASPLTLDPSAGAGVGRQMSDSITALEAATGEGGGEEDGAVIEEEELDDAEPVPARPTALRERRRSSDLGRRKPSFGASFGALTMSAINPTPKTEGAPKAVSPPPPQKAVPPRQQDAGQGGTTARQFSSSRDIAAELMANPKLAALRSPTGLQMTPMQAGGGVAGGSQQQHQQQLQQKMAANVPPILADPKCSGYFLEPMKWMEPFLESGQLAGKIVCPNKKCGAKLGNYDWAGVKCSCKEWVTPGFCIHRSKVDEVV
ncbi:hypothetical protein PUNSTDRAFT_114048 [Punctularia strigosozonata HHB-11173 SS5]|uniref:uncharacterized protein n=1 Tax=Punctularia strigosozonata (strain HHB-11173) TaxID=741275 RepID=UPI0004417BDC|nr:uncharacterized protein PUNSTDRAFT_114048 [Punctularia strigosozonata HHB-11173 SS5]EIN08594.1 hypothetical protein PUNSTDRAFT_114048 [Punctularia strigosozonata HHB-11173 SS5]